MKYEQKYAKLYDITIDQGGATVRIEDYPEKIVSPKSGFAVGDNGSAIKVERGTTYETEAFDLAVDRVIRAAKLDEYEFFGTWFNKAENTIYVEPVEIFADRRFAMGVTYGRGEQSTYDLANDKEIFLS